MYIIDAHEDISYNALVFGRDYRLSAADLRRREQGTLVPSRNGQALLGWPEYQQGKVALIFATTFITHRRYAAGDWEDGAFYLDFKQARQLYRRHLDYYRRLCDPENSNFRLVRDRQELAVVLAPWKTEPENPQPKGRPIGLVMLMENAEGIEFPQELEEYWDLGLRIIGPVWSGGRFCGGTNESGKWTREGRAFLETMAALGFILDISHMNEESALEALDSYPGQVISSHANCRSLIKDSTNERQLTDRTILRLLERGGVMGLVPFNRFIKASWKNNDDRSQIRLADFIAHIDHICQMAGDAGHVALGTDYDGGFGWPAVPLEIDTIADLRKLIPLLAERGYSQPDIAGILGGNWTRILETCLPA